MNFTLDDIYNLTIRSKRRIEEYNIETFSDICIENEKLLKKLIDFSIKKCNEISDENIKKGMMLAIKNSLLRAYKKQQTIKPKDEYAKLPKSNELVGYFKSHPDAEFVARRFQDLKDVYSYVVEFLNKIYGGYKVANKKEINSDPLWEIFAQTKMVCEKLGIRSRDEDSLYEMFSNPNGELAINEDLEVKYDEENSISNDIGIVNLPYDFAAPTFSASKGLELYRLHICKGKAWYNETYLKSNEPKSFS